MFRIVCPYCHIPLSLQELELIQLRESSSLVCPDCEGVLLTANEAHADLEALQAAHAGV
jgi:hypothetical protein